MQQDPKDTPITKEKKVALLSAIKADNGNNGDGNGKVKQ